MKNVAFVAVLAFLSVLVLNENFKSVAGTVYIETVPGGAQVIIDDLPRDGVTPMSVGLVEGVHELRLELDGYQTYVGPLKVVQGENREIKINLVKK